MMTEAEVVRVLAERDPALKLVGLMKRGLWYRPNARGYTRDCRDAWRLTVHEAKKYEYLEGDCDEWVQITRFPTPDYLNSRDALASVLAGLNEEEWASLIRMICPQWKTNTSLIRFALTYPPADLAEAVAEVIKAEAAS